jgi:hypothetical protein
MSSTKSDREGVNASNIVLTTLNAKYIHASLGLRYLLANMSRHGSTALRSQTVLREFTIHRPAAQIVADLLALNPRVIGFGVYIWNVTPTTEVLRLIKAQRPDIRLVLGGPEVSHEWEEQTIVALADHLITGWGDVSFPKLCLALLHGPQPLMKVIAGEQPPLADIDLPYEAYSDEDLAHRVLYVEASRGCPFKCEFCLSSLDKTAWAFELEAFLQALDRLYQRGARQFKFVDRTFNLKIEASVRILQFFLDRLSDDLFVHFELIPDHLPQRLKALISQFPAGVLQFEIGVQSLNEDVQQRISRRQDNPQTLDNLRWLLTHSQAHLHTDLIFGLPGETWASFATGFDQLYALAPHEIQLGLLKRLRGTPIARHTVDHSMVYDDEPPYSVQHTAVLSAQEVQAFIRLARYWDLVANAGRFGTTLPLLMQGPSAFAAFSDFSQWLWAGTTQTRDLSPEQLVDALHDYLTEVRGLLLETVRHALLTDYLASGARGSPQRLRAWLPVRESPKPRATRHLAARQDRHTSSKIDP